MDDYISGLKTLLYMQVIIVITITIFIIIIWWKNRLEGLRTKTRCTMDMPKSSPLFQESITNINTLPLFENFFIGPESDHWLCLSLTP